MDVMHNVSSMLSLVTYHTPRSVAMQASYLNFYEANFTAIIQYKLCFGYSSSPVSKLGAVVCCNLSVAYMDIFCAQATQCVYIVLL